MRTAQSTRRVCGAAARSNPLHQTFAARRYQSSTSAEKPQHANEGLSNPQSKKETPAARKKTIAEADAELKSRLEAMSGDGGAAGVEYENGSAEGLKSEVKRNMFRLI